MGAHPTKKKKHNLNHRKFSTNFGRSPFGLFGDSPARKHWRVGDRDTRRENRHVAAGKPSKGTRNPKHPRDQHICPCLATLNRSVEAESQPVRQTNNPASYLPSLHDGPGQIATGCTPPYKAPVPPKANNRKFHSQYSSLTQRGGRRGPSFVVTATRMSPTSIANAASNHTIEISVLPTLHVKRHVWKLQSSSLLWWPSRLIKPRRLDVAHVK